VYENTSRSLLSSSCGASNLTLNILHPIIASSRETVLHSDRKLTREFTDVDNEMDEECSKVLSHVGGTREGMMVSSSDD
jgi:hypothetical protein